MLIFYGQMASSVPQLVNHRALINFTSLLCGANLVHCVKVITISNRFSVVLNYRGSLSCSKCYCLCKIIIIITLPEVEASERRFITTINGIFSGTRRLLFQKWWSIALLRNLAESCFQKRSFCLAWGSCARKKLKEK